jgi:hypothetical protein
MNRMYATFAAGLLVAGAAVAQEEHAATMVAPQVRVMSLQGGVMGKTVKGAPYSGVEVSETTQTLADGTRIHNESQTQVYRDSEGRMRRETGNEVTIWDPVANASWVLNTKTQTARKLPMGTFFYSNVARPGGGSETMAYSIRTTGGDGPHSTAVAEAERKVVEARIKRDIENNVRFTVGGGVVAAGAETGEVMRKVMVGSKAQNEKTEGLGKRMIEGLNSDGVRNVATIEAGTIGNDRPIQTVSERWYSPELQTVMINRHTDPRTGEESFKLINVSRAEPAPYLFQAPAGYQVVDQK